MEENLNLTEQTTTDVNVNNDVNSTVEQPSGKGKIVFFGILGCCVLGPIAAVVLGILLIRNRNQKKQLQAELEAEKAKNAAQEAPAASAPVETKAEETKTETPETK